VDRFPDEHGVLVLGEGLGEAVEEDLHGVGIDGGQDQRESGLAAWPGGAEEVGPLVALVLNSRRALAARPPAVTEPPLLADAPVRRENTPLECFLFRLTP
jgi:hypothetical protein